MKTSTIVNIILGVAVVTLYIIYFTGTGKGKYAVPETFQGSAKQLSLAYIKMDSMLYTYDLAKKLNSDFTGQQETFKKEYTDKRIRFEREAAAFQEKVQRGGFLTEERAKQEQERLIGVQQEIQKLDYELTQKLTEMQAKINQQIVDSISSYLKTYNAEKKYDLILNSASMLEGSPQYNITREVSLGLNARYNSYLK